ncbi:hypothetical protein [Embleya sp. NPDC050493]|uniref:hypothetical protein n=1 Tax=Embleya sp. NPDC050493 TaxID=3363989 RepID=UPI003798AA45
MIGVHHDAVLLLAHLADPTGPVPTVAAAEELRALRELTGHDTTALVTLTAGTLTRRRREAHYRAAHAVSALPTPRHCRDRRCAPCSPDARHRVAQPLAEAAQPGLGHLVGGFTTAPEPAGQALRFGAVIRRPFVGTATATVTCQAYGHKPGVPQTGAGRPESTSPGQL